MPTGIYKRKRRKKHVVLRCLNCGKAFEVPPCHARGRKQHCCWKCRNEYKKGKNFRKERRHHITPLIRRLRELPAYYLWRSKVFERDNWTCQTCQKRGYKIEAHHSKSFTKIVRENKIESYGDAANCKELWDISNGVTLCKDCHNLTKKGKGTLDGNAIQAK